MRAELACAKNVLSKLRSSLMAATCTATTSRFVGQPYVRTRRWAFCNMHACVGYRLEVYLIIISCTSAWSISLDTASCYAHHCNKLLRRSTFAWPVSPGQKFSLDASLYRWLCKCSGLESDLYTQQLMWHACVCLATHTGPSIITHACTSGWRRCWWRSGCCRLDAQLPVAKGFTITAYMRKEMVTCIYQVRFIGMKQNAVS